MRNFFSTNLFRISAIALFSIPLIVIFRFLAPTSANAPLSRTPTTVATVETTEFAIAAPYWSVEDGFVSTIEMKNYRVDQSLTIMPILYPLHGSAVALDPEGEDSRIKTRTTEQFTSTMTNLINLLYWR
jgi:hypothetical protein